MYMGEWVEVSKGRKKLYLPSCQEFVDGVRAFEKYDRLTLDATYGVCSEHIRLHNGDPREMAQAVFVLVQDWYRVFYRGTTMNVGVLAKCIDENLMGISSFSKRLLVSLSATDGDGVKRLFRARMAATNIAETRAPMNTTRPVSAPKALHMLAPSFFPAWDSGIASRQGFYYSSSDGDDVYLRFCFAMKMVVGHLGGCPSVSALCLSKGVTIVKLVDEYNFGKYSSGGFSQGQEAR